MWNNFIKKKKRSECLSFQRFYIYRRNVAAIFSPISRKQRNDNAYVEKLFRNCCSSYFKTEERKILCWITTLPFLPKKKKKNFKQVDTIVEHVPHHRASPLPPQGMYPSISNANIRRAGSTSSRINESSRGHDRFASRILDRIQTVPSFLSV